MNRTKIEWTDYTWNPVTGCTKVSQGCKNCYAETLTKRFGAHWGKQSFRDVTAHPERLNEPVELGKRLHGKKVFVCDMSDLFHEDVPFIFILAVFDVMKKCYKTTFQVLTKRIDRAHALLAHLRLDYEIPKNMWIGTSCEDQKTADERIPLLLRVPSTVRFVSCEPLLGPIDLNQVQRSYPSNSTIAWVIAGGESGHNARPMHPDWLRSLRDQCAENKVPFFFKQWGEYMPFERDAQPPFYRCSATGMAYDGHGMNHIDPETSEAGRWMGGRWYDPMDAIGLCIETDSHDCTWLKLGKHKTGHKLDGKTHLEFPNP